MSKGKKQFYMGDDTDNTYVGDAGRNHLWGRGGNDTLSGGDNRDFIWGGTGNDTLDGEADRDRIWGGTGDDTIIGGTDRDLLSGGTGADTFVFAAGDGNDRIRDFTNGIDHIDLSAYALADATAIIAGAEQHNDYVLLDLGNGDTVRLDHMTVANLDATDFIL